MKFFWLIWLFVVFEKVHTICYMHKFIGSMIFNGLMILWRSFLGGNDLSESFENRKVSFLFFCEFLSKMMQKFCIKGEFSKKRCETFASKVSSVKKDAKKLSTAQTDSKIETELSQQFSITAI